MARLRCTALGYGVEELADTVAFCPPLLISETQIDEIFDRFGNALEDTLQWVEKNAMRG